MNDDAPRLLVDEIGLTFVRHRDLVLTSLMSPVWRVADGKVSAAGLRATATIAAAAPALEPEEAGSLLDPPTLAMHVRNFAHALQFADDAGQRLFLALTDGGLAALAAAEAGREGIDPSRIVAELEAGSAAVDAAAAIARAGLRLSITGLGPEDAAGAAVTALSPGIVRFDRTWLVDALAHRRAAPLLPPLFDSIRAAGMEPHVVASADELRAAGRLGSLLVEGPGLDEAGDLEEALREAGAGGPRRAGAKVIRLRR